MASKKPPRNDELDRRIAERQEKLDAYVAKYDAVLQAREKKYAAQIAPTWAKISDQLTAEIQAMYSKYADKSGQLSTTGLREVERLQALRQHVAILTKGLEGQAETLTNNLVYTYADSFYFHAFGLQQAAPLFAVAAPALSHADILGLIANPWVGDGKTYSDRLRANTAYLAGKVDDTLRQAVGGGWDVQRAARRVQDIAGEGYSNSVRIARTELNRAAGQASSHSFMQNADLLSGKRWNATLDSRTAPKDAQNDGDIFDLDYDTPENPGVAGKRIPNHPNCRCKWSPVLASLGVREGERIARGEGDSPTKFGDRVYTKARTYKAYAKERGIDLDEKLRNDDPNRYLRQGEKDGATPAAKSTATPTATKAPAAASWAEPVKARIAQGVTTEAGAREVGSKVLEEVEKHVAAASGPIEGRYAAAKAAADKLYADTVARQKELQALHKAGKADLEEVRSFNAGLPDVNARIVDLRQKAEDARRELADLRGGKIVEALSELRPMGSSKEHQFVSGSQGAAKDAVKRAQRFLPTKWLEDSQAFNPLEAKVIKRGYYRGGQQQSEFRISGATDSARTRVALHELGHRMEHVIPLIKALEHEFYSRRTTGEKLKSLGKGYGKNELTRFDDFLNPYMGKDYGNKADSYYELLSMGLESAFLGSNRIADDPDFYAFILGVLASV